MFRIPFPGKNWRLAPNKWRSPKNYLSARANDSFGYKLNNMKQLIIFGMLGLILLCTGCLNTFYPIFTEKDLVSNEKLVGKWQFEEELTKSVENLQRVVIFYWYNSNILVKV